MARAEVDFAELEEQAHQMEQRLGEILAQIERAIRHRRTGESVEEEIRTDDDDEPKLSDEDRQRLDDLFEAAAKDRSRAYELKQELDRLKIFADYEDRFLDLFRE